MRYLIQKIVSQPLGSISSGKISRTRILDVVFSYGIQLGRKDTEAWSPVIWRMLHVQFSSLMPTVTPFLISGPESLDNLQGWIDLFKQNRSEKAVMVVCANKIDLERYMIKNIVAYTTKLPWKTSHISIECLPMKFLLKLARMLMGCLWVLLNKSSLCNRRRKIKLKMIVLFLILWLLKLFSLAKLNANQIKIKLSWLK